MDREAADHYFGDPAMNGSPHPDARPPIELLEVALDAFLAELGCKDWRVVADGDEFVEVEVYDGKRPGLYVVRESGAHERVDD